MQKSYGPTGAHCVTVTDQDVCLSGLRIVKLLTHGADHQTDGHGSVSPVEQFEGKGFGTACWKVPEVQTSRLA